MKKLLLISALLLSSQAYAWDYYCTASSPYASGWGASDNSIIEACNIALRQCASRTPLGYSCYTD